MPPPRSHDVLLRRASFTPGVVLAVLGASAAITVIAHGDDLTGLNHVSGVWLGLAQQADHGRLPPPVTDRGFYGGTRYMPASIALLAGGGRLVGNVASGRAIALLGFVAVLALLGIALRRAGLPWGLTAAALLVVPASGEGFLAALTIRFDVVALALSLGAVTLLSGSRRTTVLWGGALAGAAPCVKLTSLWAIAAGTLWLLAPSRRRLLPAFLLGVLASVAVFFVSFAVVPGNDVVDNLRRTSTGEDPLWRLDRAVNKLAATLAFDSSVTLLALGAAVGVLVWALTSHRAGLWHLAWALSAAQLLAILPDRGVDTNHLLDLTVLSVLLVGTALAPVLRESGAPVQLAVALGLVAYCSLAVNQLWRPVVVDAARQVTGRAAAVPSDPLEGVLAPDAVFLSEDPGLPAVRDQRAILVDPFLFRRLALTRPELTSDLVRRLDAHEFDAVVLLAGQKPEFYRDQHLGSTVYEAILRDYPTEQAISGHVVRRPANG